MMALENQKGLPEMEMPKMADDELVQMRIRLQRSLHEALAREANANRQSINAEIVQRLRISFEQYQQGGGQQIIDRERAAFEQERKDWSDKMATCLRINESLAKRLEEAWKKK
jgi:predicted HicB family RNase H-like nuclease